MKVIRGCNLTPDQREQVKSAYVHWHVSGFYKTQDEFIHAHAFHFTYAGQLARNIRHAVPEYLGV